LWRSCVRKFVVDLLHEKAFRDRGS